jgi:hypothetical protein
MPNAPLSLFVAIPTYGGVQPEHAAAVLRLQAWALAQGLPIEVVQHGMTEIARSRNILATRFLEADGPTHLLFIDSDIAFEPGAVAALIAAQRPVVGAVYPKRQIDLDRLIAAARRLSDRDQIVASAMDYVVLPDGDHAEVVDGLVRAAGLGMGLCLIERGVFTSLLATGRIKQGPKAAATQGQVPGFFDPIELPGEILSEDLSFCRRWRELCGGEVWAMVDQPIAHIGTMAFRACMLDALKAGRP